MAHAVKELTKEVKGLREELKRKRRVESVVTPAARPQEQCEPVVSTRMQKFMHSNHLTAIGIFSDV